MGWNYSVQQKKKGTKESLFKTLIEDVNPTLNSYNRDIAYIYVKLTAPCQEILSFHLISIEHELKICQLYV